MRNRGPRSRFASAKLAFYVTSHGFGHLNRAVAVINHVPAKLPVVIRSHPNLFPNWRERLTRPAELTEHVSDAGAVNPPGDSTATDGPATLELAARVHAEAMTRVDEEAAWLRKQHVAALLCDAPAVPLVAARRAGIPGCLLANFTWADIYAPYARAAGGDANGLVADLRRAYRQASTVFRAEPALRMAWLPGQINVGMVANPGRDRRKELRGLLGLSSKEKLIYFYVGRYGQDDLDWARLENYAVKGFHFVGYHLSPVGPLQKPTHRACRRLARQRSDRLDRRLGRQGRLRDRLRGDGRQHADHLPATPGFLGVPGARSLAAVMGRRHPGIGA